MMENFVSLCDEVFEKSIADYHLHDDVDAPVNNPYAPASIAFVLYEKNQVDTIQWHLEDIIRNPGIDPVEALTLKRRIDASNQHRTDLVENLDAWFLQQLQHVAILPGATINTESPAWAIDRYSILHLKLYHMRQEAERTDATEAHRNACHSKLNILLQQQQDLATAITMLLNDMQAGRKYMKVYKQMKMYNDESLNPVLYRKAGL